MRAPTLVSDLELLGFSADWLQLKMEALRDTGAKLEGVRKQIRDRFHKLALIKHPDIVGKAREQEFIEIRAAFERLQQLKTVPKQVVVTLHMQGGRMSFTTSDGVFTDCTFTIGGNNEGVRF